MIAGSEPLLRVRGLCKYFPVLSKGLRRKVVGYVKACHNVNLDLMAGETLGLVGESGSGKTTMARVILRAMQPTAGDVFFRLGNGEAVNLAKLSDGELKPLRTRMQMIFQDPFSSLNPRMTVKQIVAEPLVVHCLAKGSELEDQVCTMLRRVGIPPECRNRYPHAFSGGQRQRIGIARALIMNPSLVVCDEPVSALDVSVQAQMINLLADLQDEFGLTYIFIAHDLSVVKHLCDRVAVMYAGRIVELAPKMELFENPKHPYTQALLASVPVPDPDRKMKAALSGEVADLANLPAGCAFHPRCAYCFGPCKGVEPMLKPIDGDRLAACHLYDPAYAPAEAKVS